MSMEEIKKLEAKKLEAEILKMNLENEKLKNELRSSFSGKQRTIKRIAAGVTIAIILAAYIKYIFLPTQLNLLQKVELAEFTIEQNSVQHSAQIATLELLKTRVEDDSKKVTNQLKLAETKLREVNDNYKILNEQLEKISKNKNSNTELKKLQKEVEASSNNISNQLANLPEQESNLQDIENISREFNLNVGQEGWIYIGYYPKGKWDYRTIEIENEPLQSNTIYVVSKDVNLRTQSPKLTLRGYDFGDSPGHIVPGQKVLIQEQKEVGRSKIWAKVRIEN